jgi:CYTH domain-containing protein
LSNTVGQEVLQGYIQTHPDEIRLRKKGGAFYLTKKSTGGLMREEDEVEILEKAFEILWSLTQGKRIEKTRYVIPLGGLKIELDIYPNGKMTAEVELPDKDYKFDAPDWFDKEVIYDERYKNKNLAIHGFPER